MKKAIGKYRGTIKDSQLWKTQRHSNCHTAHTHDTPTKPSRIREHVVSNSVTQVSSDHRGKPKRGGWYQGESQPLCQKGLKAVQQVSAFGPAHAEQARKLYHLKGTRCEQRQENYLILPHRSNIRHGSLILLSQQEQAQIRTNDSRIHKESVHVKRVQFETSWKKEVPITEMLEQTQPILKIVTILERPGKCKGKLRNFSDVEHSKCERENCMEKKPFNYDDGVGENGSPRLTILQLLEN